MAHKTVRALVRGIQVLRALQRSEGASLNDLHQTTQLDRATLLRLLATLEGEGLVWRRLSDGLYRASSKTADLAVLPDPASKLAEISVPVLRRLVNKVIWPSDLAILHPQYRTFMYTIETSRPGTPFPVYQNHIGHHINLPYTALGLAYLAFCPEAEREALVELLSRSRHHWDRIVKNRRRLNSVLAEARERGYAVRDKTFLGGDYERERRFDDRLSAMAIPVMQGASVIACINVVWLRKLHSEQHMAQAHLHDLRTAAAEIAAAECGAGR